MRAKLEVRNGNLHHSNIKRSKRIW